MDRTLPNKFTLIQIRPSNFGGWRLSFAEIKLRRGVTWAVSKQLELWLSTHELAMSQREPAWSCLIQAWAPLIVPDFLPEQHEKGLKLGPNQLVRIWGVTGWLVPFSGPSHPWLSSSTPLYRQYFPLIYSPQDGLIIQFAYSPSRTWRFLQHSQSRVQMVLNIYLQSSCKETLRRKTISSLSCFHPKPPNRNYKGQSLPKPYGKFSLFYSDQRQSFHRTDKTGSPMTRRGSRVVTLNKTSPWRRTRCRHRQRLTSCLTMRLPSESEPYIAGHLSSSKPLPGSVS